MIFDTNVLIYADRGLLSAKDKIMNTRSRAISAVTYVEYVPFCRNRRELLIFENLLQALQFKIYEIDHSISFQARQIVRQFALSHSVELGDAVIAATALKQNETLCTSNLKHFSPIMGLTLEPYSPEDG